MKMINISVDLASFSIDGKGAADKAIQPVFPARKTHEPDPFMNAVLVTRSNQCDVIACQGERLAFLMENTNVKRRVRRRHYTNLSRHVRLLFGMECPSTAKRPENAGTPGEGNPGAEGCRKVLR